MVNPITKFSARGWGTGGYSTLPDRLQSVTCCSSRRRTGRIMADCFVLSGPLLPSRTPCGWSGAVQHSCFSARRHVKPRGPVGNGCCSVRQAILPVGVPNTFSSSYRPTRGADSPGRYSLASTPHRSRKARHPVDLDQLGGFCSADRDGDMVCRAAVRRRTTTRHGAIWLS
jgi:hypothetical protein